VAGLLEGGKVRLEWNVPHAYWGKDWAKLLMNATLLGADCLPRGGLVKVDAGSDPALPSFKIHASGVNARVTEEVERSIRGESQAGALDARGIQPFLTHRLSRSVNAGLTIMLKDGTVELSAG
jgi:histidine phosphotransferase ChpT